MKALIVDDEVKLCEALEGYLQEIEGLSIDKSYDGKDALEKIWLNNYDLVISDINLPYINGLELLKKARKMNPKLKFILISGIDSVIESINSIELGVTDFLTKPIDTGKLAGLIETIKKEVSVSGKNDLAGGWPEIVNRRFISQFEENSGAFIHISNNHNLIAASLPMKNILKKLDKLRDYPEIPVLIEGKTGVGKEVAAQYLHFGITGGDKPFVALNCGAISKNLFESELFGYDKGAFTGADPKGKDGKIKLAENGTLFLDEITEISLEMQVKLLRVIQEKEYYKVGGTRQYPVNARIVCAGNRSIPKLIHEGEFREDLYYRLNVCKILVPSLKQRKEDIAPLVFHFMEQFNHQNHTNIWEITGETLVFLENCEWPGNIRELKNAVFKALLFNEKSYMSLDNFNFLGQRKKADAETQNSASLRLDAEKVVLPELPFSLEEFNHKVIEAALVKFGNNKTKAAEFLGLNRVQMYYRYKSRKDKKE